MPKEFFERAVLIAGLIAVGQGSLARSLAAERCVLENPHLRYVLSVENGRAAARRLENRLTGRACSLPAEQFRLEFQDGTALSSLECQAALRGGADQAELLFSSGAGVEARVRYSLAPGKAYLRKQISLRQTSGPARRLIVAELDSGKGVKAAWTSMRADR